MQFQADLLGIPVIRSDRTELTAWGAAKLAGLQLGFWKHLDRVDRAHPTQKFVPRLSGRERLNRLGQWRDSVRRLLTSPV
jgi:glycerol kinase